MFTTQLKAQRTLTATTLFAPDEFLILVTKRGESQRGTQKFVMGHCQRNEHRSRTNSLIKTWIRSHGRNETDQASYHCNRNTTAK